MGWNDHINDPDAWEDEIAAYLERADLERKRSREFNLGVAIDEIAETQRQQAERSEASTASESEGSV